MKPYGFYVDADGKSGILSGISACSFTSACRRCLNSRDSLFDAGILRLVCFVVPRPCTVKNKTARWREGHHRTANGTSGDGQQGTESVTAGLNCAVPHAKQPAACADKKFLLIFAKNC